MVDNEVRVSQPLNSISTVLTLEESKKRSQQENFNLFKEEFSKEQQKLKTQLVTFNSNLSFRVLKQVDQPLMFQNLNIVAGVDLSFFKKDPSIAIATVALLDFTTLKKIHCESLKVQLTVPYVSGYLAFREVPALLLVLDKLVEKNPNWKPDLILVDGNGVLHPKKFGLACHLGVVSGYPTIGVAKKFLEAGDGDLFNNFQGEEDKGIRPLVGDSGYVYGNSLIGSKNSTNPIFVSVGHRIDLDTATAIVQHCCKFRIPEPIRIADLTSRQFVRDVENED